MDRGEGRALLGTGVKPHAQVGWARARAYETALLGLLGMCRQPQRGDGHSTMDRQTHKGIMVPQAPGSPRDTVPGCAGDPGIPWHSLAFPISSSLEPTHRCRPPRPWHAPQLGARISHPALANPVSSLMP